MRKGVEFWLRVAITLALVLLVIAAPSVLLPFIVSLVITILLNPVAGKVYALSQKYRLKWFPYDLAIIISFALFVAVIYMIIIHIFVPFVSEFQEFVKGVPEMMAAVQQIIPELEKQYQLNVLPPEAKSFLAKIVQDIGEYTLKLAQFSISAIFSFASTVIELIVVPFITFYMMKSGSSFINGFIHIFPERFHHHLDQLFKEIHFVLNAYIRGQLILSTLMALVVFVGMWALNIPYPLVIGLLAGIVEMIPLIGPIIGALPPVLLGLLQGSTVMIKVIVFYIIVQQLDGHLVMPKLMGTIIKVHPVSIIAAVLICGHVLGVVGMMIAVPLVAVLQILLRHMWFYDRYKN
ncbi:AI-2E family transporter [uncultured Dialister sp.]|uniref:AI-2E family transporter n=1 Tax=uncultured Dialister sp. TaxID=278064 RepID=UPI0025D87310|nr:AI-2E family transporter [uncultured Dialister sp.]